MEKEKSYNDIDRKIKEEEIKRLTDLDNDSPLEPRKGILTDDEILKYAGDSKAASEIRLKRGVGTLSDKKSIYEEPLDTIGLIVLVYTVSILPAIFIINILYGFIALIPLIIIVIFIYYLLFLKDYTDENYVKTEHINFNDNVENFYKDTTIPSIKSYEKKAYDLENLYKIKEKIAIDLIEKKFFSNSITYDKFLSVITTSRTAFYNELSEMFSIIETTTENNEKINTELLTKNANLKRIIEKLDELTNELVINLNTTNDEDEEEIKILLEDMESLINSVKDYK